MPVPDVSNSTLFVPPTKSTPVAVTKWLRKLATNYHAISVQPIVLAALANQYDRRGMGLYAAEARAAAQRLVVRYRWQHPPTGFLSRRTFDNRGSAWMHLSRLSRNAKGLRRLAQKPNGLAGVRILSNWDTFVTARAHWIERGNIPDAYRDPVTGRFQAPVAEFSLIVSILSGYVAKVSDPTETGLVYGTQLDVRTPFLIKEV